MSGIDCIGLALDLEARAKTVESQTTERVMIAAAQGLRLLVREQALAALTAEQRRLGMYEDEKQEPVAWGRKDQLQQAQRGGFLCAMYSGTEGRTDLVPLYLSPQQEPDRLDAERYRALRDHLFTYSPTIHPPLDPECRYLPSGLDAVCDEMREEIDAAKEAKP